MELVEGKQKSPNSLKRNKDESKPQFIKVYLKGEHSGAGINKSSSPTNDQNHDSDFDIIEMKYSLPYIPNDYYQWHKNKQKAWKLIPSCPSLYYFFYLAPGLHEATYPPREKDFIDSLRNYPPQLNGWGLFSLHLPGFTGKQCYDYYLTLLSEKKVSGKYKSLPVFQKTDVLTYYTSYINACKSYTVAVKEEHHHHKAPAYNRHNNNTEKQKTKKHIVEEEEEDDEEEDDDEVIETRKTKKNKKTKKDKKKKKTNKTSRKTKKSKSYKYIVDDSSEELSEEEEEVDDGEETEVSDLFSITAEETSHEEDNNEESDDDDDDDDSDEDCVIKLVRKKPKNNNNNSKKKQQQHIEEENSIVKTPQSKSNSKNKNKLAKVEITPTSTTTTKSIESTPSSSISIRNEVESSPFLSPSSNIISVKTTPDSCMKKNIDNIIMNESVSEVHTPDSHRSVDESHISPPPLVKRSTYYQPTVINNNNIVDENERDILDSPVSDDYLELNEKNHSTVKETKKLEEKEIKEKEIPIAITHKENVKPTKTIVFRKRKLENITEGYSNKRQKNLISLLARDYTILPDIKIPSISSENSENDYIPYEFQLIKYHCEVEFRRLTQTIINSIEILRREYNDVSYEGDKKKEDKVYKFVVDELKSLENKYNEGIIDIQRRYNAQYLVLKSFMKQKEYNDENISSNSFINPFYM